MARSECSASNGSLRPASVVPLSQMGISPNSVVVTPIRAKRTLQRARTPESVWSGDADSESEEDCAMVRALPLRSPEKKMKEIWGAIKPEPQTLPHFPWELYLSPDELVRARTGQGYYIPESGSMIEQLKAHAGEWFQCWGTISPSRRTELMRIISDLFDRLDRYQEKDVVTSTYADIARVWDEHMVHSPTFEAMYKTTEQLALIRKRVVDHLEARTAVDHIIAKLNYAMQVVNSTIESIQKDIDVHAYLACD